MPKKKKVATTKFTCAICDYAVDELEHRPVRLPCSHSFCLTCLVRLQNTKSRQCPLCRDDWSFFTVEPLPGMVAQTESDYTDDGAAAIGGGSSASGKGSVTTEKSKTLGDVCCQVHSLPFLFWCETCKELICKRCVVVQHKTCEFTVIEDAILLMKTDINERIAISRTKIKSTLDNLEGSYDDTSKKLSSVIDFKDEITKMESSFFDRVAKINALKAEHFRNMDMTNKIESHVDEIEKEEDVVIVQQCRQKLAALTGDEPLEADVDEQWSLLCGIACTYMVEYCSPTRVSARGNEASNNRMFHAKKIGTHQTASQNSAAATAPEKSLVHSGPDRDRAATETDGVQTSPKKKNADNEPNQSTTAHNTAAPVPTTSKQWSSHLIYDEAKQTTTAQTDYIPITNYQNCYFDDSCNIFVGNLPQTFTESDLHTEFEIFGKIKQIRIIKPNLGSSYYGFVAFIDEQAVKRCLQSLPIIVLEDHRLNVQKMQPKQNTSDGDGGRYGRPLRGQAGDRRSWRSPSPRPLRAKALSKVVCCDDNDSSGMF